MWLWDQSIHKIFNDIAVVNECSSSPCNNNGHCVNLEADYTCICQLGFDGERCESGQLIFKKNYDHCIYKTEPIVWYYTESALYKLQGLANLIHVTTMVHVSLTECLHFAHVWQDSLGKIVHKVNLNYLFFHSTSFYMWYLFSVYTSGLGFIFQLQDVNECLYDPCDDNFTCKNTVGGYECLSCATPDNCSYQSRKYM